MNDFVGAPDEMDLATAWRLLRDAWALVADAFARQQVVEYGRAASRPELRPAKGWHPWVPGLHWYQQRRLIRKPLSDLPDEAVSVARDMLSLERVPGVLPEHAAEVAKRIGREGARALWEVRLAAQYAASGITVEWSAVTNAVQGAPDVTLPDFHATIQVKCLDARDDSAEDPLPALRSVNDARRQLSASGPGAIVVAVSGATSLQSWRDKDSLFRAYMSEILGDPRYSVVSAIVFVAEPIRRRRSRVHFYGNPAWWLLNPAAAVAWPSGLLLVTDDPEETM